MKRILLAGAAVLALTAAQPTLAADAPVYKAPVPAAAAIFNWSGFYIGVSGGYAWGKSDWEFAGAPLVPMSGNGWLVGGTVGANWQTGALVLGVEGDWSWANVQQRTFAGPCVGGLGCRADVDSFGTIRGRIGLASGSWLFYATGGWAFARLSYAVPFQRNPTQNASSWTAGVGIEAMLSRNWTVKGEYLYADLGTTAACPATTVGCAPPGTNARNTLNIVRAGLNYKF